MKYANVPGIIITDLAALRAWLDTTEHSYNCTARSEGMLCCLDEIAESVDEQKEKVDNATTPAVSSTPSPPPLT